MRDLGPAAGAEAVIIEDIQRVWSRGDPNARADLVSSRRTANVVPVRARSPMYLAKTLTLDELPEISSRRPRSHHRAACGAQD